MLKDNIEYKRFVWEFSNILKRNKENKKLIFLCVGTNKVIGDSIGPMVGTNLINILKCKRDFNFKNSNIKVIGDMSNNISYNNIEDYMKKIKKLAGNNFIIVIDSALSSENNIGKIFIHDRGLKYAESLKRKNNVIGDVSIKAVVGKNTQNRLKNFKILRNASTKRVMTMANILSKGIIDAMCLVE